MFMENMRSWVAWCFMETLFLIVMSNLLTTGDNSRKNHRRYENWRSMYTRRTCAGLQVQYVHGKYAKLGGVVLFVDTHPSTNILESS